MAVSWDYSSPLDPDPVPDAWVWERLRNQRNALLTACDWTQLPDSPVNAPAWATYRQALRDLPDTATDPRNAAWPDAPAT